MAFCHLSKNRWCNRTSWELRRCRDNGTNIATENSLSRLVQSSKSSPQLLVRRINRRASQYSKHAEKRTCGESKEARKIAGTQQSRKERNNYSRLDKKKVDWYHNRGLRTKLESMHTERNTNLKKHAREWGDIRREQELTQWKISSALATFRAAVGFGHFLTATKTCSWVFNISGGQVTY